mmetsp:Transcript_14637/g.22075  ORF Transcript_14637/g.22075 Transcript_14637/m.22075 type:complete len:360 (-) Transcript_14637:174-1253(-)|eukprot:CAMPEP_0185023560 /NCGR_PEP_ID=MMETSP1103-20130426/6217_1 /TAXON_ID=36769 /ORGANISM="Paraphysomonas bandaiensis, Strain Caron Lab Isolate" /LENGTH=359 /DNA_ID=CAMNT_0027556205 /DNA_START=164 /DNA_END=1243 /DNA_ORIENTATION=+
MSTTEKRINATGKNGPKIDGKRNLKDKPKAGSRASSQNDDDNKEKSKAEKLGSRAGKRPQKKEDGNKRSAKKVSKKHKKKKGEEEKVKAYKPKRKKKNFFQKLFSSTPDIILRDPRALEAAEALHFNQSHLKKLRDKFDNIDVDGSGNIDTEEFFEACGENRSPITDRLFQLIDLDGSGTIEFEEYIRILATYCMYTKDEILTFCFETFDKDGSNAIDEKEFVELCKHVNNAAPTYPGNFKRALEDFDVNDDGLIDYAEFCELERRYPLILFPAFRLQDALQRHSLGEKAWLRIIENYNKQKKIEEYKATHGGKLPPDPFGTRLAKSCCPCMFREKVHIRLGADMEARHRAMKGEPPKK